ncbi:hypothetical protein N7539_006067 [Penicillium diatomitis]|uniref:MutL C-terminal dimerisation domain-containing protein n=1 Tax=Penicillium diatomitis TaxID=2819901 RepID=A0A9W9X4M8_9EURO|nr:uncharacterized protein N7539_006067 [Penicillium diatomitis]KAJ5483867.1 hypothetical protein N7539_006067 [Penicillium diatomitis]
MLGQTDQSIRALPPDVAFRIKSSTSIIDLHGVVLELVKNSLDAGAQIISVTVDFKRGGCVVEDNGQGIVPGEFESSGGLGKAYHTSKYGVADVYGHRGLFLSSLASLSLLTVTSRHEGHSSTSSIVFHRARPVARLVPVSHGQGLQLRGHGTRVAVHNLFGNMPVRVRNRALNLKKPGEMEKEWEILKHALVSLTLANGQLSKLSLSDESRGRSVVLRPRTSENEIDLGHIGSILSQSGYTESPSMNSWQVVSASTTGLHIQAAMSTSTSLSKKVQFISLGKDPVFSWHPFNVLYGEINQLVASSGFGAEKRMPQSENASPWASADCPSESMNVLRRRSGLKPISRWPMFVVRIDARQRESTYGDEPSPGLEKSIQEIRNVLQAMVMEFLNQQELKPFKPRRDDLQSRRVPSRPSATRIDSTRSETSHIRRQRASVEEDFASTVKLPLLGRSRSAILGTQFSNWSRIKSARENEIAVTEKGRIDLQPGSTSDSEYRPSSPKQMMSGAIQCPHYGVTSDQKEHAHEDDGSILDRDKVGSSTKNISESASDTLIPWVDPRSGKLHQINSRTGQTVNLRKIIAGPRSNSFLTTLQRHGRSQAPRSVSAPSPWVDNLLETWQNPVFSRAEARVPSLEFVSDIPHSVQHSRFCQDDIVTLNETQLLRFRGKLNRQSLRLATVIAQVDRKFILAKLGSNQSKMLYDGESQGVLVLIDQHAADERCRVEQLFEDLFISPGSASRHDQVQTVEIDPITLRVSSPELKLFQRYSKALTRWGISYRVANRDASGGIISVITLPTVIAERCRLEPELLGDLIRREVSLFEAGEKPNQRRLSETECRLDSDTIRNANELGSIDTDSEHLWVHKMNGCPQGILDLLNSRACRGAIMFNDDLDMAECERLVARLSKCAFPFQCAHGRPSMIPILDMRAQSGFEPSQSVPDVTRSTSVEDDHLEPAFLDAFRKAYRR